MKCEYCGCPIEIETKVIDRNLPFVEEIEYRKYCPNEKEEWHKKLVEDFKKSEHSSKEREITRPRYDLIPKLWLDELASIFEEGAAKYGENSWKNKSPAFYKDCLNHAQDHLSRFNDGDLTENQLPKVAWNVLAVVWALRNGKL